MQVTVQIQALGLVKPQGLLSIVPLCLPWCYLHLKAGFHWGYKVAAHSSRGYVLPYPCLDKVKVSESELPQSSVSET